MRLEAPHALWALLSIPALVGIYAYLLQRRSREVLRYSSLKLVLEAVYPGRWIGPHASALTFLVAIVAVMFALSRPVIHVGPGGQQRTLIVAIDMSISMAETDLKPNRLAAAKNIAREIVSWQPKDVRVGVVGFGANVEVFQMPTMNRMDALSAIDKPNFHYGTGIGTALMGALIILFPESGIGVDHDVFGFRAPWGYLSSSSEKEARTTVPAVLSPRPDHVATIVLLSDGDSTFGVPVSKATKLAADGGVRVFTVRVRKWRNDTESEADHEPLKKIARLTGGKFISAGSDVQSLKPHVRFEPTELELESLLIATGMLCLVAAAAVSLRRHAG